MAFCIKLYTRSLTHSIEGARWVRVWRRAAGFFSARPFMSFAITWRFTLTAFGEAPFANLELRFVVGTRRRFYQRFFLRIDEYQWNGVYIKHFPYRFTFFIFSFIYLAAKATTTPRVHAALVDSHEGRRLVAINASSLFSMAPFQRWLAGVLAQRSMSELLK